MQLSPLTKKYLIQSILIHIFVGVIISVFAYNSKQSEVSKPKIIRTRILKFGKKRAKNLLPRKTSPKKTSKNKKVNKTPLKKNKHQETKKAPLKKEVKEKPEQKSAKDLLAEVTQKPSLSDLIDNKTKNLEKEEIEEGSEQGLIEGKALTGHLKASYNDKILQQIESKMEIPRTINDRERQYLKTLIFIRINSSGIIIDSSIFKSSGQPAFDNAALLAVKRANPYGAPPLLYRDFYSKGFKVEICPQKCSR